jgi:hypothetical protein
MKKEEILNLSKEDIRTIQVTKRGLSTSQQKIYKILSDRGIRFGEQSFSEDGRSLGIGTFSDKSVRREGWRINTHFFYYDGDKKVYLPSERDLWDEVAAELLMEKRERLINNILESE